MDVKAVSELVCYRNGFIILEVSESGRAAMGLEHYVVMHPVFDGIWVADFQRYRDAEEFCDTEDAESWGKALLEDRLPTRCARCAEYEKELQKFEALAAVRNRTDVAGERKMLKMAGMIKDLKGLIRCLAGDDGLIKELDSTYNDKSSTWPPRDLWARAENIRRQVMEVIDLDN